MGSPWERLLDSISSDSRAKNRQVQNLGQTSSNHDDGVLSVSFGWVLVFFYYVDLFYTKLL